ncbi:hypothetical protein GKE82_19885 [Conexibacter sp. W3-3-2]|uniref:Uncharacterized protein n=1 Tax=Paraconexibacter algicola TaxID=2133960 RepID=A0A2T4ULN0_9ACTN|nr:MULTISPECIES: hypothetical protein [Solirubrobacterales]MTD46487.1 hypothetical protein [Conexibacter sp. W3-3-2]PTL60136.1 hypothetical protein C7Y72_11015 [Paraconexibacter algicola]
MKGIAALVAIGVAVTITVLVLAIIRTHDDVSDDLARCIEQGDAAIVRGPDLLGPLRADLANGFAPRVLRRYRLGENGAVLLEGTGYRVLALDGRNGPSLEGEVALRIFRDPSEFAVVGVERDPMKGVLAGCASLQE